jgi:hypothetical protein
MFALMFREVDAFRSFAHARERGVDGAVERGDERDDGAVVGGIGRDVEDRNAIYFRDRRAYGFDDFLIPALRKIGHTLDKFHGLDGRWEM